MCLHTIVFVERPKHTRDDAKLQLTTNIKMLPLPLPPLLLFHGNVVHDYFCVTVMVLRCTNTFSIFPFAIQHSASQTMRTEPITRRNITIIFIGWRKKSHSSFFVYFFFLFFLVIHLFVGVLLSVLLLSVQSTDE